MFNCNFNPLSPKLNCFNNNVGELKKKKGNLAPKISTKMRYAQIVNSVTKEGRQTNMTGAVAQQKYPNAFVPRSSIIVPFTN